MIVALHVITVLLVALAAALSVAHALELPGKMRLAQDQYLAVQQIYYPGFTIGGAIAEPGGTIATAVLLLFTPVGGAQFRLVLAAFVGMLGVMAVFWLVTQPVNKVWTKGMSMGALGSGFFETGADRTGPAPDWTALRDRWEYSHVTRAALATASFICLVVALAIRT